MLGETTHPRWWKDVLYSLFQNEFHMPFTLKAMSGSRERLPVGDGVRVFTRVYWHACQTATDHSGSTCSIRVTFAHYLS